MLFDTHAHLNDRAFADDAQALIARMGQDGLSAICLVGWDEPSSRLALQMAKAHPRLWCAAAISPQHAADPYDESLVFLRELAAEEKCVCLGEMGLDYHYDYPRDAQMECLLRQSALAVELDMPVSYHVRDAWGDFLPYLKNSGIHKGIMHCFAGSVESARVCLDVGLHISFSGSVTFKNARNLQEVARYIPAERLLIETDSPYLSPVPLRGQRNQPSHVIHTAQMLADLRGTTLQNIADTTRHNAAALFGITLPQE